MLDDKDKVGEVIIEEKTPDSEEILISKMEGESNQQRSGFDNLTSSVKGVAQKTGEVIGKATESIGKAIESAFSAKDHMVIVNLDEESSKKLDMLVQAGVFDSRSAAAAFLIAEGIKAQSSMFSRISERIAEIDRIRTELKSIIPQEEGK